MSADIKRVALYLRVSTDRQSTHVQRSELTAVCEGKGWLIVDVYEDAGISGAIGRNGRPEFNRLLEDAARHRFDVIAAWSVDRLGRSLQDLVGFLSEIQACSVDLYLHRQAVDTTTPSGRALFGMLAVFAEFERTMISARVTAGIHRAKAAGKKWGKPPVTDAVVGEILRLWRLGETKRGIAQRLGISDSTVRREIRRAAETDAEKSLQCD